MTTEQPPSQTPAVAQSPRQPKFQPVMQIELSAAKPAAPAAVSSPLSNTAPPPARPEPPAPVRAMPLNPPSPLAFRAWPKFSPVIQIPVSAAHPQAPARRWKMHRGRMAITLGFSALTVIVLMSFTLLWPTLRPANGIAFAFPTQPATATARPATATRRPPTASPLPQHTATPQMTSTPNMAATLSAAVAATLTAQPTATQATAAPQASPTAALPDSSATPLPTPFMNQGALAGTTTVIFDETFTPGGYWDTGDTPYALREISNGQLLLHIKNIGSISWSFNGFSGENFYVQGATSVTTCRAGDYYGLIFRARDDSNFYMFGISCDGRYRAVRQKDGVFTSLVEFTFSPNVVTMGGYNLLGVRVANNQFSFYANDQLLASTTDDTFTQGRFGVFAKSFETPNLTVHFDDITAWNLKP